MSASNLIVVYKLSEYKFLVSDLYPGNDCSREEIDRFLCHILWVQLHPVLFIAELRNADVYSIEDTVIEYMSKYGIDSTRSTVGEYNIPVLSKIQVDHIQKKIDEFEQSQMPARKTTRQWNRLSVNTAVIKPVHHSKLSKTKTDSPTKLMNSALYHCSYD